MATALYQALPPASDPDQADQPGEGRKLLLFSDSRQAAAYFAPYLEDSYTRLQRRRLVFAGAVQAHQDGPDVRLSDIAHHATRLSTRLGVFKRHHSSQDRRRQLALWIQQEIVSLDERNALEGTGLLRWELLREDQWNAPRPLIDLGLTEAEAWHLVEELLRTIRSQGAVSTPDDVDPNDDAFDPRRGPIYMRSTGAESKRKVLSWLPTRRRNRRVDYLQRVLQRLGRDDDPATVLDGIWRWLITGPAKEWLAQTTVPQLGWSTNSTTRF
ncbi:MAG: hypothetical protein JXA67_21290 [Micromonosporaceae bacterium]|nr:hypothetical protein [Micromonosporaceae bacterium]